MGGITTLLCERSSGSPREGEPETIERHLYLDEDDDAICPFMMGDRCFSRSQYIGWPRDNGWPECGSVAFPDECAALTRCPSGQVVSGFQYQRGTGGFISGFAIDCMEAP